MTLPEFIARYQALPSTKHFGHVVAVGLNDVSQVAGVSRVVIEYGTAYGAMSALASYAGEMEMPIFAQFMPALERMLVRAETAFHARAH